MQLVSLVHNLSQVKPASDILTYKFEFTFNQKKYIFQFVSCYGRILWRRQTTTQLRIEFRTLAHNYVLPESTALVPTNA